MPDLPPFERVVAEHGSALLAFCVARAGAQRGQDCFQETMLAALRAYDDVRDPAAIRAWLYSIAARKAIDAHRAAARAPVPTAELERGASEVTSGPDAGLWDLVRALPDKQRQALTLRYRADLSYREIAQVTGVSEAAARRSVFEGLKRLRRQRHA